MNLKIENYEQDRSSLKVIWSNGQRNTFHYLWLRDNCPTDKTPNGQRLIETSTLPLDSIPEKIEMTNNGDLQILWRDDTQLRHYPADWMAEWSQQQNTIFEHNIQSEKELIYWNAESISPSWVPQEDFQNLNKDAEALRIWLKHVHQYGFALLKNVPPRPGMVLEVGQIFGYVRETNYGSLFDVRTQIDANNLAYTDLGLSVHTDNPYRDPVPGLQLLHCLNNEATGGETLLVDGFAVARKFQENFSQQFQLLSEVAVNFHFRDEKTELKATHPIISINLKKELDCIRFNNRSVAPFEMTLDELDQFYQAYLNFAAQLNHPSSQFRMKLGAGDLLIMNNKRVLHGRTGFQGGMRHLQGCYVDLDGLLSKLRVLSRTHSH